MSRTGCLQAGYAVVFLNRRHSIQPFTKGLPSGEIMDTLMEVLDCNGGQAMRVRADASAIVRDAVARAKQVCMQVSIFWRPPPGQWHRVAHNADGRLQVAAEGTLLRVSFESLFEYLKVLTKVADPDLLTTIFLVCDSHPSPSAVPANYGAGAAAVRTHGRILPRGCRV